MYLNSLDCVEKELFLELALNACYANGELDPNEKVMMDQYGSEMGIKINSYKPLKTQSQVLEDLKSIKANTRDVAFYLDNSFAGSMFFS